MQGDDGEADGRAQDGHGIVELIQRKGKTWEILMRWTVFRRK
jgi:hypothetical protein